MLYEKTKAVVKGLIDGIPHNNLFVLAAGMSYYFVIALFPGLVLLSAVASYLPIADVTSHTFNFLSSFVPPSQMEVISTFLQDAVAPNRTALLTVGAAGTLWAASSAFDTLTTSIGIAYEARDERPFWITRPIAIALTISVGILFLIAFAVLTIGPLVGDWLTRQIGFSHVITVVWPYVRWVIAVVGAVVSIEILYFISPRKKQRFLQALPGAVLAIAGWLVLTYFLGSYFRNRSDASKLYGSLAGGIAFMVWLYWASFMILLGAQLNAEIEKARHLTPAAAHSAKPFLAAAAPPAKPEKEGSQNANIIEHRTRRGGRE